MVGRHRDFRQPLCFTDSQELGVVVISLQSMDLGSLNRRYEEKTEGLHQLEDMKKNHDVIKGGNFFETLGT